MGPYVNTATIREQYGAHIAWIREVLARDAVRSGVHTRARRPYSATLYPTSFILDSLISLTIRAQRKTHGWWYTLCPMACGGFFVRLYILGKEGRRTYQATGGPTSGYSNHHGSSERKSRGLGEL